MGGLLLIGCGSMGSALLKGWCGDASLEGPFVVVTPRESSVGPFKDDPRVQYVASPEQLTDIPQVVVCAIKPALIPQVLPIYAPLLTKDTLFVSVAAGLSLPVYRRLLGQGPTLVRVMPNLASSVGWGQSLFCSERPLASVLHQMVVRLLSALGQVIPVDSEEMLERCAPLVGCGPAYVFRFMEALTRATQDLGVPLEGAEKMTRDLIIGCGRFLEASSKSVGELREAVTSPQGMTHAGLTVFNEVAAGLDPLVARALRASFERAHAMGKEYDQ